MGRYVVVETDGTTVVGGPYLWDGKAEFTPPEMNENPDRKLLPETPTRFNPGSPVLVTELNRRTLTQRADQALSANATYLALATPTAAQTAAQVRKLTQQCSALIRLVINQLDSTE